MVQVDPSHYFGDYDSKDRFVSYWHQIDEVLKTGARSVLEIGPGNKTVANYLEDRGLAVTTADFDPALGPTVAADAKALPFPDDTFDCVACFEVMEHVPFEDVPACLREMARVTKRHVLISVPDVSRYYKLSAVVPLVGPVNVLLEAPFIPKAKHTFDGQHHWELGKGDYPFRKVKGAFEAGGLEIKSTYRVFENPYHRFFRLEPRGEGGDGA